ncbi:hypothetical protein BP6252_02947 [Coleophoma cylindrospora]|uniref:Transcription factor domain-containing protein n=1 Tax=Coleophoma cylindrospora TaxID=1849047 RepID=A0A3D8S694_9HELO|nr:hypothetical protein BP6252_02947 [Coleophoma cylindrospora]
MCMDLISWLPGSRTQNPRTTTYLAAKRYYLDLEIAGILSIQCLQAGILVAIFELGHAIYPSAFLSVAACARYGSALGLDWRTNLPREDPLSWFDAEEQSRVWWAIALLDRVANIGQPERRLIVADPGVDALLPRSDIEWDQGIMPSRPPYSVSAPSIQWGDMGPFALTAQATRLLGQVLSHVSQATDLDEEEAILLDRALRALARVVHVEGQLQDLHMMNQEAICSIALVMLHEAHASLPARTKTSIQFSASHQVMNCISDVSRSLEALPEHTGHRSVVTCVEEASPFLVTLLYLVACVNGRLQKENQTSESLEAAVVLKSVLGKFDTRWKAAGECPGHAPIILQLSTVRASYPADLRFAKEYSLRPNVEVLGGKDFIECSDSSRNFLAIWPKLTVQRTEYLLLPSTLGAPIRSSMNTNGSPDLFTICFASLPGTIKHWYSHDIKCQTSLFSRQIKSAVGFIPLP